MTDHSGQILPPEEPSADKLPREVYLAFVALGWKMPTTEQEVQVAELEQELDKAPLPERYRIKREFPGQVPTRTSIRNQKQNPDLEHDQQQEPGF